MRFNFFFKTAIIIHYEMLHLDNITNENNKEHNKKKWPCIPDHPLRILVIASFGSGKTSALLNLVSQQDDTDKKFLYAKDLSEPKYEFLIRKSEDPGTKHLNDLTAFIECSHTMDDVYDNIDDYNSNRQRKTLNGV